MTLLDERELTAEERAAIADEARPGVWIEEQHVKRRYGGEAAAGDGRAFTQDETDRVIVRELIFESPSHIGDDMLRYLDPWRGPVVHVRYDTCEPQRYRPAESQRGGIHSDPLVRLLAYRVWGDRDRRWFETTAVFGFQPGDPTPAVMHASHVLTLVAYHGDRGTLMSSFTCSCGTVFQLR